MLRAISQKIELDKERSKIEVELLDLRESYNVLMDETRDVKMKLEMAK